MKVFEQSKARGRGAKIARKMSHSCGRYLVHDVGRVFREPRVLAPAHREMDGTGGPVGRNGCQDGILRRLKPGISFSCHLAPCSDTMGKLDRNSGARYQGIGTGSSRSSDDVWPCERTSRATPQFERSFDESHHLVRFWASSLSQLPILGS